MSGQEFRMARRARGWTQKKAAVRMGVSQTYVALLERGKRKFPSKLARKAVVALNLDPVSLPVRNAVGGTEADTLARQLAALGYPGFAYLHGLHKRNPAEVLLTALAQQELESRLVEALPWLLLNYSRMADVCREWLLEQARLRNLTNRLGFVASTAKLVLENRRETQSERYRALTQMEKDLNHSLLAREDTLCQASLSQAERDWLKENRPEMASKWNLLTNWKPEFLQYAD